MDLLLTGATGTIGSEILRSYLTQFPHGTAYCVIRAADAAEAKRRLMRLLSQWQGYFPSATYDLSRIRVLWGDLCEGIVAPYSLPSGPALMVHAAACTRFDMGEEEARRLNVLSTAGALALARQCGAGMRFVHFSTAFVAGERSGVVHEDEAPGPFHNDYEASKFAAETLVRQSGLPFTILRPSIVVGHSDHGYIQGFRVIYAALRVWFMGILPRVPLDAKAMIDMVPLDFVIRATWHLARLPAAEGATVHLCAGRARTRALDLLNLATDAFGLPRARYYPLWCLWCLRWAWLSHCLPHAWRALWQTFRGHMPYFRRGMPEFSTQRAEAWLTPVGIVCPLAQDYAARLFKFCQNSAWGKKPFPLM